MDVQNSNNRVFPRQPAGNQNDSVRRANSQLGQTFEQAKNKGQNRWRGGSAGLLAILNLIKQLLELLGKKQTPPPPDDLEIRPLYGVPVAPPPDDEARAVYGVPVAIQNPADDKESAG